MDLKSVFVADFIFYLYFCHTVFTVNKHCLYTSYLVICKCQSGRLLVIIPISLRENFDLKLETCSRLLNPYKSVKMSCTGLFLGREQ